MKTPFVCINLELIDSKLLFNPPLDENSHVKNLQEILFDFINTFISRGSYMQVLGKNRVKLKIFKKFIFTIILINFRTIMINWLLVMKLYLKWSIK